jgi:hypothetical protein
MAKSKAAASPKSKKDESFDRDEMDLPEGFTRANPLDGAPLYWSPIVGEILQGEIVGRYQRRDGEGWYYQIKLTKPANVRSGDKEEREAEVDEIVNVDERAGLRYLAAYCGVPEKRYEAFIKAQEKGDIRGGKSFWKFTLGAREIH